MKTKLMKAGLAKTGLSKVGGAALTLALLTAGATAVQSRSAIEATMRQAEQDARGAQDALAKRRPDAAIRLAEHAVQLRPQDATYRALLGKAYLAAGRFFSAKQAFADALQLDGGTPGAALNYALTTTATGDFAEAQQIIDANAATIAPADRGLALALAGNAEGGVAILIDAARQPGADAKTRQNLALALALAGRWPEARQAALADLSPSDADARIVQWAAFARPTAASDQVATLLGVTPVADAGQPAQLALVSAPTLQAAAAPVQTAVAETPVAALVADEAPAQVAQLVSASETAPAPQFSGVVFGDRREVVQSLPAAAPLPVWQTGRAVAVARTAPPTVATPAATGRYYVQLGAFRGVDAARGGWTRARTRYGVLADRTPSTMPIGRGLVRVSVGGFGRSDADGLCRRIKAGGGVCFVRVGAGDRIASWGRPQLAAR